MFLYMFVPRSGLGRVDRSLSQQPTSHCDQCSRKGSHTSKFSPLWLGTDEGCCSMSCKSSEMNPRCPYSSNTHLEPRKVTKPRNLKVKSPDQEPVRYTTGRNIPISATLMTGDISQANVENVITLLRYFCLGKVFLASSSTHRAHLSSVTRDVRHQQLRSSIVGAQIMTCLLLEIDGFSIGPNSSTGFMQQYLISRSISHYSFYRFSSFLPGLSLVCLGTLEANSNRTVGRTKPGHEQSTRRFTVH